jgi:hypothetical protein
VADCINTARSVREAAKKVIQAFTLEMGENFHAMSILNNIDNGGSQDNKRIVEVNGQNITLPFLIGVHIEEIPTKKCVLCSLKIPHSDLFEDDYLKLRSHDFWKLSDKGGYEYEILKPEYAGRKRIYVPIFLNWFNDNATYVAYKFENFVNQRKVINQLNRIIIYPDETRASTIRVNDVTKTASGQLAHKLKELFNYSIIGIPRNIIDQVTADKFGMSEIKNLADSWVHSIKNIPLETDIIILDEFHKGGKTLESIRDIINWLDNKANCFFTIADFNPLETLNHREKYSELEFYNLYEFNNKLTHNEPE